MPRINKITAKKTFGQMLKQKKIEKLKAEQARIQANIAQKEAEFDSFVKQTAKDILKDMINPRIDLKVATLSDYNKTYNVLPTESQWAPWNNIIKKEKNKCT